MTTATPANFTAAAGTRAFEDLPHSCSCGIRWSGSNTTHCGTCHNFCGTGVEAFDRHRRSGRCNPPAGVGLVLIPGRAYEVWGTRAVGDE
jgi:hypothetical protein